MLTIRSGISGTILGSVSGLIRSSTPGLFAAASGIQWFALGSSFWDSPATRGFILHAWETEKVTPRQRVYASGIAGGFAGGSVGLLMRGRSNVVPGTLMFSIFGLLGQSVYNRLDAQRLDLQQTASEGSKNSKTFWRRIADWNLSPMRVLTDEEYGAMLREKLLRANAEIAIIDESIDNLRKRADKETRSKDGI
ncbi:MAG: hypothetical protein M1836_003750 [Candelina mexicana]|nr:MAG: hypothetical protein M1836_003750 [Candelina mexicana]